MTNKLLDYEKESADMKYMHSHCEKRTSMPTMWSFGLILIGKHLAICPSCYLLYLVTLKICCVLEIMQIASVVASVKHVM